MAIQRPRPKTQEERDLELAQTFVHSPAQVSRSALAAIDDYQVTRNRSVLVGIPSVDELLRPARPGELWVYLANTSNMKSTVMYWQAIQAAKSIKPEDNEVVVYVSWEDAIEEIGLMDLARASGIDILRILKDRDLQEAELDMVRRAATDRATMPIFLIGYSPIENDGKLEIPPPLTMDRVQACLLYIRNILGFRIKVLFLDYAQRIAAMPEDRTETERTMHNIERAKQTAIVFGCPVILGSQADRKCLDRKDPMPTITDGLYSSTIEHLANVVIGLLYAIRAVFPEDGEDYGKYECPVRAKDSITWVPQKLACDKFLLVMANLKQKKGESMWKRPVTVDPATGTLKDYELTHPANPRQSFAARSGGMTEEPEESEAEAEAEYDGHYVDGANYPGAEEVEALDLEPWLDTPGSGSEDDD